MEKNLELRPQATLRSLTVDSASPLGTKAANPG